LLGKNSGVPILTWGLMRAHIKHSSLELNILNRRAKHVVIGFKIPGVSRSGVDFYLNKIRHWFHIYYMLAIKLINVV
jgi:hypothetical protein